MFSPTHSSTGMPPAAASPAPMPPATQNTGTEKRELHLALLKSLLMEWVVVLGDNLQHFAQAASPQALQKAFQAQPALINQHIIFKRPHLREDATAQIQAAIADLVLDEAYALEVKKIAVALQEARVALDTKLEEDLPREQLAVLATTYDDKTMERYYRALFKGVNVASHWQCFPKKYLMLDKTKNEFKRVSFLAYIREKALTKLRAKNQLNHDENVQNLRPDPKTGVTHFSLDHLKKIIKEDKALIETTRTLRRKLHKVNSFFSEPFAKKLKRVLAEKYLWFSPGFQGSATLLAKEMRGEYIAVTEAAERLITGLEKHQLALEERLNSLPTAQDLDQPWVEKKLKTSILAHRLDLQQQIDKVVYDLVAPKAILEKMYGTGLATGTSMLECNGVLETMEDARREDTGQMIETALLHVSYRDYLPSAIPSALKPTDNLTVLKAEATTVTVNQDYFKEVVSVPRGQLRIYEMSRPAQANPKAGQANEPDKLPAQVVGRFTEKRSDSYLSPNNEFTILSFPDGSGLHPKPNADELHAMRIEFAMSMMLQMLMNLGHKPSKAHPLYIKSTNSLHLQYLTSAALAIQEISGNKLDPEAISLLSNAGPAFPNDNWPATLGIGTEGMLFWKKNKLDGFYEKFKASPFVTSLSAVIQALDKQKFIPPEHKKKLLESEYKFMRMGQHVQKHQEEENEALSMRPTVRCK